MLHQQGTKIVDERGTEVRLRGVNLGGWLLWEGWIFGKGMLTSETTILARLEKAVGSQQTEEFRSQVYDNFIAEADIQKIAQAGFNVVRVPLNHRLFQGDNGWKLLDRMLRWCENYKVYVILDLHAVPGGQSKLGMADPGDARHLVWVSEENQTKTVAIWKAIAARYRNRKIIAGYDLVNEPEPPSGDDLVRLYQRIIRAVRAEDPDHLIILEGRKQASDFSMFDKPLCENQAFSFHMYTWFGDDRKKKLAAYQAFARKENTPLWVGEFGENSYEMIRSTVEMYDRCPELNGWVYWTWKKAPTKYPGLVVIRVPEDWQTVMTWVGSLLGSQPPQPATIRAGMKEFIEAMKLKSCDYDKRMAKALVPKG
jgi:endoglucanase